MATVYLARDEKHGRQIAIKLLRDVVEGVAHTHRHGVVHSDIKPDNVMLAERHALLMDFGVAKAMSDYSARLTRRTRRWPAYLAE